MSVLRKPAVAGYFYPKDPIRLAEMIERLLDKSPSPLIKAISVVSPHAGYMYSGYVAASVYARVYIPEVIVILGPNHTGVGASIAVMDSGIWSMPFGDVPIEEELAESIINYSQYAESDYTAHLAEHSIEVQIPFIQYFKRDISIVPIAVGTRSYKACEDLGKAIAKAVKEYPKDTLIVSSTDLTHYESQKVAMRKDQMAISAILELNPLKLYKTVMENNITMCGVMPTVATLEASLDMGASKAELVKYMTSGDVTGDFDQVVGYAGIIIY